MLISLQVKNLALIEEAEVTFQKGLNVLTGETGAGKSILIGSINLALGAKADKDLIRTGEESAYVELVFSTEDEETLKWAKDADILPEDGMFILSRRIYPGRSVCKINGETVTAKQMKELSEYLLDVHGQHEHESLLKVSRHREILDSFCKVQLKDILEQLEKKYKIYHSMLDELENYSFDETAQKKEQSLVDFEYNEIDSAKPVLGEDEQLEAKYRKMVHSKKIIEAVSIAHNLTGGDTDEGAAVSLGRALREMRSVTTYDEAIDEMNDQLQEIEGLLSDFNRSISEYMDSLVFDEYEFKETEDRLNLLNHLKAKYGSSIEEVLTYQRELLTKKEHLENYESYKIQLEENLKKEKREVIDLCQKVSEIRKEHAKVLSAQMQKALEELNFLQVRFEIRVEQMPDKISAAGFDYVEMLLSTNPGESLKPLANIASGGELSRIMLAIKTVLAGKDEIDTLIFDEIDTGISGKTAWMVSEKMGQLARCHQLICITHLPQIAAMADTHFLIEKTSDETSTATHILKLSEEESTKELARMLGGAEITKAVLDNAAEMKNMAKKEKQY